MAGTLAPALASTEYLDLVTVPVGVVACAAPAGVVFSSETRPRKYRRVEVRLAATVAGAGLSMSAPY
jgi:hypothetical protein